MSLQLHEWDIHIVWPGTDGVRVTKVRASRFSPCNIMLAAIVNVANARQHQRHATREASSETDHLRGHGRHRPAAARAGHSGRSRPDRPGTEPAEPLHG